MWSNLTAGKEKPLSEGQQEGRGYFPPFSSGGLNQFDMLLTITRGIRDVLISGNYRSHYKKLRS